MKHPKIRTLDLLRMKFRYYGIDLDRCLSDIDNSDDLILLGRIGLSLIESTCSPADSFYIQNVKTLGLVNAVMKSQNCAVFKDIFEMYNHFRIICPDFYQICSAWPASIQ